MIDQNSEPHICYECDAEYVVTTPYDDISVAFCPFCGAETADNEDLEEDDEEDYE
jgi:uncharacterized Zn ribbon protein